MWCCGRTLDGWPFEHERLPNRAPHEFARESRDGEQASSGASAGTAAAAPRSPSTPWKSQIVTWVNCGPAPGEAAKSEDSDWAATKVWASSPPSLDSKAWEAGQNVRVLVDMAKQLRRDGKVSAPSAPAASVANSWQAGAAERRLRAGAAVDGAPRTTNHILRCAALYLEYLHRVIVASSWAQR